MIKLMKYLKRSAGYIVLIIALLFLQADVYKRQASISALAIPMIPEQLS